MKFDKDEPSTHARESESSLVSSSQPSSSPQQDQYLRVLAIVTLVSAWSEPILPDTEESQLPGTGL